MAAPLSGIGQQQTPPVTQALQPVNTDENRDVRRAQDDPQDNQVQVREAPAAQSQETQSNAPGDGQIFDPLTSSNSEGSESRQRGSIVDIQV